MRENGRESDIKEKMKKKKSWWERMKEKESVMREINWKKN